MVAGLDSRTVERWNAYMVEKEAIRSKLNNGVPKGKEDRLKYRLNDIEDRLIPELVLQIQLEESGL